jgi:hypothetical protein
VEFCNFDAIIMSDYHEVGGLTRVEQNLSLEQLLEMGKVTQAQGKFTPPPPKKRPARVAAPAGGGPPGPPGAEKTEEGESKEG